MLLTAFFVMAAFALTAVAMPWWVRRLHRQNLIAHEAHHLHTADIPHGGGLPMVVVASVLMLCAAWGMALPDAVFLTMLAGVGWLIAAIGWWDDVRPLHPRTRLVLQLLCVAVMLPFLPDLFDFIPQWLEKFLIWLAWGWFINLYNFMDGSDGYSGSEAVFLGTALALFIPDLAPVGAILAACGLGFLTFNWPPARVFMGDVGATWLGFVFGGLLFIALKGIYSWPLAAPLFTLTLLFSMDATYTIIRRMLHGKRPWNPDTTFWFNRAHKVGLSHAQVLRAACGLNLGLFLIAALGLIYNWQLWTIVAGLLWLLPAMWWVVRRENKK